MSSESEPAPQTAREKRSNLRREQIESQLYDAAARLFAERGFGGTSLKDIANSLGVSRTMLYYYVASKDELLARIVHEMTDAGESLVLDQLNADGPPETRLAEVVTAMTRLVAHNPSRFRLVVQSQAYMPDAIATEHRRARRSMLKGVVALIEEGQRVGTVRPADSSAAAFALFGMWNWTAFWVREDTDVEKVCAEFAEFALRGLLTAPDNSVERSALEVLGAAQEELVALAVMLRED